MLRDIDIVALRSNPIYNKRVGLGLKGIATDLIVSGKGDFKPEVSTLLKITYKLLKARVIRKELAACSRDMLEKALNYELQWERTPHSVRSICQSDQANFLWMRYDRDRVEALFSHSQNLITDADFRNVVKSYSALVEEQKNQRLNAITNELLELAEETIRSIRMHGLFNDWSDLRKDEYYKEHEGEILDKFLAASKGGALGQLPAPEDIDNE